MADDLSQFLQQVAQRRAQRQAQSQAHRPHPQEIQYLEPANVEIIEPLRAEIVQAEPVDRSVSSLAQMKSQLGEEVGLADDKMEAHLQQVFDHQVGRLQSKGIQPKASDAPRTPTAVDRLIAMLRSPQGIQSAVVLHEVFQRPDHRW